MNVIILGAGLSGCETALQLANRGITVDLYEMKPVKYSTAHKSENFAELVCSNSFGKELSSTANGVLINELQMLESYLLQIAKQYRTSHIGELVVDREKFSKEVTRQILENPNIKVHRELITQIPKGDVVVIATGPLTDVKLAQHFEVVFGKDNLSFQDSTCPIIYGDSIDTNNVQICKTSNGITISLTEEQFNIIAEKLRGAKTRINTDDKTIELPQCSPIEYLAKKDIKTLLEVKFAQTLERTKDNFATVTLRKENSAGQSYSIAGFMTQMTQESQRRVIRAIPGLERCKFARYGRSHRNTFLNAPKILNKFLKANEKCYIIGQLSGIDGYIPAIATGLMATYSIMAEYQNEILIEFPKNTILGGFSNYITAANENFSPMIASFHLIESAKDSYDSSRKALSKWIKESKIFHITG